MQNAFVESMKTIAKLVMDNAGYDKTRTGKIVAVNSVTNTYTVKVDGLVYNNVKAVNDSTYNTGDTVKINIPMNNASQAYISSSILSDDSFGNKIAQATSAIDAVDERIDGIVEIMGKIYQLSIGITYATRTVGSGVNEVTYTDATYTAILTQDGEDVTDTHSSTEFNWYLEKTTGRTMVGDSVKTITLSSEEYLYGQSVILEWIYDGEVKLRSRVTLFNENAVEQIAKYTTEITSGGVFVHRADGVYDVGADWESPNAYGVKITESVDVIKGGEIYGSFGGNYLTIGHTSYKNVYISNESFIQLRDGSTVLTDVRPGSITLGRTATDYYNVYMDTQHLYFRQGENILSSFTGNGMTVNHSNGQTLMSLTNNGLTLYNGDASNNIDITQLTPTQFRLGQNTQQHLLISNNIFSFYMNQTYRPFYLNGNNGNTYSQNSDNTRRVTVGYQAASGQPGIQLYRISSGTEYSGELRMNDTQKAMQVYSTNAVVLGTNNWYIQAELQSTYINIGVGNWATQVYMDRNRLYCSRPWESSDRRIKQHIQYLSEEEASNFVRSLRPALFYKNDIKSMGLYAQDVRKLDKWNVFTQYADEKIKAPFKDFLILDYTAIMMPLISYCQNLEKRISQLENKE